MRRSKRLTLGILTKETEEKIDSLHEGVIETGQQPNCLGGSSLVINKIVCADIISKFSNSSSLFSVVDYDGTRNDMGRWGGITDSLFQHLTGLSEKTALDFIPKEYSLSQNYPNPFNPRTTIEFSIPEAELVTLKVYNLLGQRVTTLVSEILTPGKYKYTWEASQMASGVYIYKIQTGGFQQVRKMVLLK